MCQVITCCNDGLRPVIMRFEATDEESKIDYEPMAGQVIAYDRKCLFPD